MHAKPRSELYLETHANEIYLIRQALRSKFCKDVEVKPGQLLYVSRTGSRAISNEEDLVRKLGTYSKTVVSAQLESLSLQEQAKHFCSAEIIVGMHGAAFTWVLAASTNSVLVEIFPYGWAD